MPPCRPLYSGELVLAAHEATGGLPASEGGDLGSSWAVKAAQSRSSEAAVAPPPLPTGVVPGPSGEHRLLVL